LEVVLTGSQRRSTCALPNFDQRGLELFEHLEGVIAMKFNGVCWTTEPAGLYPDRL
jgi:hypothetical protein